MIAIGEKRLSQASHEAGIIERPSCAREAHVLLKIRNGRDARILWGGRQEASNRQREMNPYLEPSTQNLGSAEKEFYRSREKEVLISRERTTGGC